jgi:hypothetical protein
MFSDDDFPGDFLLLLTRIRLRQCRNEVKVASEIDKMPDPRHRQQQKTQRHNPFNET